MHYSLLTIGLLLLPASAATAPSGEVTKRTNGATATHTPSVPETGPLVVPEPSAKAMSYYHSGNVLWAVNTVWALTVPAFFLFTGLSAKLRNGARWLGRWWFFTIVIYWIVYLALTYVLDWPLNFYEGYVRQHDYGLSNQTFGKWQGDSLKGLVFRMVAGSLFLWVPYLLIMKSPRRWWLYTAILTVPFAFLFALLVPILFDPLFNDFYEMKDKALEAKILALARRAGIEEDKIYEVDKGKDTNATNAYVTGFLGTKRIVLWDTTIEKFKEKELLFIVGHEMGHFVLNHVVQGILFGCFLALIGLYMIYRVSGILIRRYKNRFGFDHLGDIASLPLLLLLVALLGLLFAPVPLAFSRHIEHEADRFGLEITQDNHAAGMSFVRLQEQNLDNPWPGLWYKIWRSSHPPIGERVEFSNTYRPWETGHPLRYGYLFNSN
jgi:Zn-dependent protease with chaperone function